MRLKSIVRWIKNPCRLIASPKLRDLSKYIPDKTYVKCMYRSFTDKKLNLKNPAGFNEKLQWLKLYDRKPIYTEMVDKYAAKQFVADRIGEEYIIKTLGVWDKFEDIDFDALPDSFVLKCTHDSAGLVICTDKLKFDYEAAKNKLNSCLKRNFYYSGREWQYKNVVPRIIAEEYMEDTALGELRDYKFFTFGAEPKIVHIVSNRNNPKEPTYGDFYDMEYKHLDLTMGHDNAPYPIEKPENFEKMKEFARILSAGTKHLRVDFYEVNGKLYFGELTFYQDSGVADIVPLEWDAILGSWIKSD